MKPEAISKTAAQEIGARLREARERLGWSLRELGAAAGVSYQSIHGYEAGTNVPQVDSLMKLAATLGVPLEAFLPDDYMTSFRGLGLVVLEGKVAALRRGLLSSLPSSDESNSEEKASYLKRENSIDRIAA